MNTQSRMLKVGVIITILALLIPARATMAQEQERYQRVQSLLSISDTYSTIDGTVSSIQGTILRILEDKFSLDVSKARIQSALAFQDVPLSSIGVGSHVYAIVEAPSINSSSPLEVDSILVEVSNEGVIGGSIQEVDPASQTFTVLNQRVLVNDKTIITKLEVGKPVLVILKSDGTDLLAIRVFSNFNSKVNIVDGVVSGIQGASLQILDGRLTLDTAKAKITPTLFCQDLPLSAISVGMKIYSSISNPPADKTSPLEADFIFVSLSSEGTIRGSLQEVDPASRTISFLNQRILVNDKTIIRKRDGRLGSIKRLKAGKPVFAILRVDGTDLLATLILQLKKNEVILIAIKPCD